MPVFILSCTPNKTPDITHTPARERVQAVRQNAQGQAASNAAPPPVTQDRASVISTVTAFATAIHDEPDAAPDNPYDVLARTNIWMMDEIEALIRGADAGFVDALLSNLAAHVRSRHIKLLFTAHNDLPAGVPEECVHYMHKAVEDINNIACAAAHVENERALNALAHGHAEHAVAVLRTALQDSGLRVPVQIELYGTLAVAYNNTREYRADAHARRQAVDVVMAHSATLPRFVRTSCLHSYFQSLCNARQCDMAMQVLKKCEDAG